MTTIFLNTYKLDLANEMDAHCWELMQARQAVRGLHKTVLPWNTKRPEKCGYDMYPCGHHRITPAGEIFYDWVVYDNARIKAGYILELVDIPPLAAPPADEVPMVPHALTDAPSRTAQAVEWLQAEPGRTQAAAAALFSITQPTISAALTHRHGGIEQPAAPSRTAQAVEWLQAEPGRTQAAAAALFDITQPAISAALTRISKR